MKLLNSPLLFLSCLVAFAWLAHESQREPNYDTVGLVRLIEQSQAKTGKLSEPEQYELAKYLWEM